MAVLGVVLGGVLACSVDEDLSAEEHWKQVREQGAYCCTHDGKSISDPERCEVKPGSAYLQDFSDVDASGRGDACGWVLQP